MKKINWSLLLPVLFIVVLSLATLYSIEFTYFRQQALFVCVSLVFYFVAIFIDYEYVSYYSWILYGVIILALAALFFIGVEAKGAVRWVEIFGVSIQFSEIFKPAFVLFFAAYLTRLKSLHFIALVKSLLIFAPIFFLVLRQPDLGNAAIYLFVVLLMLLIRGFPLYHFVILGIGTIASFPILFHFLQDYQKNRIYSFINTTVDPTGISYNAVQSMISVGSGGLFGKGFGQATQSLLRFLPERHTDFIFASLSETLGLLGGTLVLVAYFFLLYKIYKLAQYAPSMYAHLVITGLYFFLIIHIFLNIGMNIGIVPIVGITLPFLSYGGSSLLTNFIILGIVTSLSSHRKRHDSLEIR